MIGPQTLEKSPDYVAARNIEPGDNFRTHFDQDALRELAESISAHGLMQRIVVREVAEGSYQIIAGERRFRAMAHILDWQLIPVEVAHDVSDEQASVLMFLENEKRADLLPSETAAAYARMLDVWGVSVRELADRLGKAPATVARYLALLDLSDQIVSLIDSGGLQMSLVESLAPLSHAQQTRVVQWVLSLPARPTVDDVKRFIVSMLENDSTVPALFTFDPAQDAPDPPTISTSVPRQIATQLPRKVGKLGDILDAYTCALLEDGKQAEALVILDLWSKLDAINRARLPVGDSRALSEFGDTLRGLIDQTARGALD